MATLREAVEYVAPAISPGRCPVDQQGRLDEDTVRAVNAAGRVLAKEGDWEDLLTTVTFNTVDHRIVLPDLISSIRAAKVGDYHQQVRSPYFFHSQTGPGANPTSHSTGLAGNLVHEGVFPTQHELPAATRICVLFSEGRDEPCAVTVMGLDASRAPVTETFTGAMTGALAVSVATFFEITSVSKDVTAAGLVRVMAWDVGQQAYGFPVVTMPHWERSGNYRRYYLPGLPAGQEAEVFATVKLGWNRDFTHPSDRLPIGNLFSLSNMAQALRALDSGNPRSYQDFRNIAMGHMVQASEDVVKGQHVEIRNMLTNRFTRRNGPLRRRRRI